MAYVDFKEIKAQVSIKQAAEILNLKVKPSKNQLRGACPACNQGDDRALVITPERGLFYCFAAKEGGDCLALVQHITGLELKEAAEFLVPHTRKVHNAPQPTAERKEVNKEPFDPVAFQSKLEYTPEIEALGISEEDAKALCVGVNRGRTYIAMRYASGTVAGFAHVAGGKFILPKNLLPDAAPNVVRFQKRV